MSKDPKGVGDMSFASQRRHSYVTPSGDFTDKGIDRFTPGDWNKYEASGRSMTERNKAIIEQQREEVALNRKRQG